jgi:hypothetical protein
LPGEWPVEVAFAPVDDDEMSALLVEVVGEAEFVDCSA